MVVNVKSDDHSIESFRVRRREFDAVYLLSELHSDRLKLNPAQISAGLVFGSLREDKNVDAAEFGNCCSFNIRDFHGPLCLADDFQFTISQCGFEDALYGGVVHAVPAFDQQVFCRAWYFGNALQVIRGGSVESEMTVLISQSAQVLRELQLCDPRFEYFSIVRFGIVNTDESFTFNPRKSTQVGKLWRLMFFGFLLPQASG